MDGGGRKEEGEGGEGVSFLHVVSGVVFVWPRGVWIGSMRGSLGSRRMQGMVGEGVGCVGGG